MEYTMTWHGSDPREVQQAGPILVHRDHDDVFTATVNPEDWVIHLHNATQKAGQENTLIDSISSWPDNWIWTPTPTAEQHDGWRNTNPLSDIYKSRDILIYDTQTHTLFEGGAESKHTDGYIHATDHDGTPFPYKNNLWYPHHLWTYTP